MGSFLSSSLGTDSQYQATPAQAGNPYDADQLSQDLQRQNQIYNQQQALAGTLQQQANGTGPNPSQVQYQQNVNQNIANTQGMIASQRGLNPALAAKLGANAGAQANQQAAGQSALLQQQQQLGASNNLGNLYGQMQQGNLGQQGLYTGANNAAMQTNAAVANANQQAAQGLVGGGLGAIGSALTMAHGGMVRHYADGGPTPPKSKAGEYLSSGMTGHTTANPVLSQGFGPLGAMGANPALASGMKGFASGVMGLQMPDPSGTQMAGGPGDAMGGAGSEGEMGEALEGSGAGAGGAAIEEAGPALLIANRGGSVPRNLKAGGHVGGKAKVKGDSLKNDTVPAMLSPGEIVIPRSVLESENAPDKARAFVAAILAKNGGMKRK